MIGRNAVVVVVPALNEEAFVGAVVRTMPSFVDHVVVVDDGSTDATSRHARAQGARVLRHPRPRGVGRAIAVGYQEALRLTTRPTDVLCVMAGDGQMHPDDLEAVVRPIVAGEADYTKGDRFDAPGVRSAMGLGRWIGGKVFSRLTSLAVGATIHDSQCGFTALSREAAATLEARGDLDRLWPSFGYPNDLLGLVVARGFRVVEVPVRPIYGSEQSKLRLRHLPPIFYLIVRAAVRRRGAVVRAGGDHEKRLPDDGTVSS